VGSGDSGEERANKRGAQERNPPASIYRLRQIHRELWTARGQSHLHPQHNHRQHPGKHTSTGPDSGPVQNQLLPGRIQKSIVKFRSEPTGRELRSVHVYVLQMFHTLGGSAAGAADRSRLAHLLSLQLRQLLQDQPQEPSTQSLLRAIQSHYTHRTQERTGPSL
jgi:hypothetical protein